jgi:hypothetical protein
MFGFAWLSVRQAQEAIRQGRLEEALRLLEQPDLRSHRKRGELALDLGRAFAERGERHLAREDAEAAWRDLLHAEALAPADRSSDRLRRDLLGLGLAELRALLQAGEIARADEARLLLRQRGARSPELLVLEEGLSSWLRAVELADLGELALALDTGERAKRLLGVNERLTSFLVELARRRDALPEMLSALHQAASEDRWAAVLEKAEQVLALAPQHPEARGLRTRAWRALEPATLPHPGVPDTGPQDTLPPRFVLWVDGVGGYLVCLGSRLTFGQARPGGSVDVPVVADVSRVHASLSRDKEGYVLEAMRAIQVNGASVKRALLQSGDRVTLGASCQFLFRLPVPGSNTARLELVSGHRLPTGVDAVLLMAEALILGGPAPHIAIPGLEAPIVLFRHKDGLGMRYPNELLVNGQPSKGRTVLPPVASVAGDEVSFAVEPL